jgi:hypothetical protein
MEENSPFEEAIRLLLSESFVVSLLILLLVVTGYVDGSLAVVTVTLLHTIPRVIDSSDMME